MRISIIVPAFNEELLLAASLVEIENAANAFANRGWVARCDDVCQAHDVLEADCVVVHRTATNQSHG